MKTFYILWGPSGHANPRARFDDHEHALKVAEVMTKQHRAKFYVMQAVSETAPVINTKTDYLLYPSSPHRVVADIIDKYASEYPGLAQ